MDLVEVLSFLFMLSTMELGRVSHMTLVASTVNITGYHSDTQEYSTDSLSETQKVMLEDLRDYGLVWQRKVRPFKSSFVTLPHQISGIIQAFQSYPFGYHTDLAFASITYFEYFRSYTGKLWNICCADYGGRTAGVYCLRDELQDICVHW